MSIPSCSSAPNTGGMNPSAANTIATRLRPMPARTLWRAIASERRPMRTGIGHPLDAVDEDDRVRRLRGDRRSGGPIAIPTSASASAGASLTPSPTITTGRRAVGLERAHELELLLGRLLGVDAVHSDLAADLVRDGCAVTGCHGDVANPCGAQVVDEPARVRPQVIRQDHRRREAAIDADEHRAAPGAVLGVQPRYGGLRDVIGRARSQAALPTATRRPSTTPSAPCPGPSSTSSGKLSDRPRRWAACTSASARECAESWSSEAAEPQRLVRAEAVEGHEPLDLRAAPA